MSVTCRHVMALPTIFQNNQELGHKATYLPVHSQCSLICSLTSSWERSFRPKHGRGDFTFSFNALCTCVHPVCHHVKWRWIHILHLSIQPEVLGYSLVRSLVRSLPRSWESGWSHHTQISLPSVISFLICWTRLFWLMAGEILEEVKSSVDDTFNLKLKSSVDDTFNPPLTRLCRRNDDPLEEEEEEELEVAEPSRPSRRPFSSVDCFLEAPLRRSSLLLEMVVETSCKGVDFEGELTEE